MPVDIERDDDHNHVAHLRVDFGELNLLGEQEMIQLGEAVEAVPADVGVVTIAAPPLSAARGLTAGLDLEAARDYSVHDGMAMFETLFAALEAVRDLPAVTVCGCGAYTLGAGLELAMACDLRIAPSDGVLGLPEVTVGLPTVIHGGLLVRQVGETVAKELIYTGEPISGDRARTLNLVTDAVPEDDYADRVATQVATLAEKSPRVLARQKQAFRAWRSVGLERGIRSSRWLGALSFGTPDQREGMAAFLEDRDPAFEGS